MDQSAAFAVRFSAAVACFQRGDLSAARAAAATLTRAHPHESGPWSLLGAVDAAAGDDAAAAVALERALALNPDDANAGYNLGRIRLVQRDYPAAVHWLDRVVRRQPGHVHALTNLAFAMRQLRQTDAALALLRRAVAAGPDHCPAWNNLGNLLNDVEDYAGARAAFARAVALDPALDPAWAQLLFHHARICDWRHERAEAARINALGTADKAVPPFPLLAFSDDPAAARRRAEVHSHELLRLLPSPSPALTTALPPPTAKAVLRLGYLSPDFGDHPVTRLMLGLLQAHDRSRFHVTAYSCGQQPPGALRDAALGACDAAVDLAAVGDVAAAERIRADGIDILIDLAGHTLHSRSALLSWRLAPLQIGFLGYPGTLALDAVDYLIADAATIPPQAAAHYTERLIRLPCFQPNDQGRDRPDPTLTRAACGLPEHAVVFAAFNNTWKIRPAQFAQWLAILAAVPDSVLWLASGDPLTRANLAREASAAGIDPARLHFATHADYPVYLARFALADLFLDCFPYGAHTTASDALWAGLPVLTRRGRSFHARVGASLLATLGLDELIADSADSYTALATALAHDAPRRASLRARLAEARATSLLFDTAAYARAFEAGLAAAWARACRGAAPADIAI